MRTVDPWLDLGGAVWVSGVVEQMVPTSMLCRALRRHRRYEVCYSLALGESLSVALYAMNSQAMDLIVNQESLDSDGWRPRFASLWTVPLAVTDGGSLKQSRYWIVTDMLGKLHVRGEPLGTMVLSGSEMKRYGNAIFRGSGPRDIAPALALTRSRNILAELEPEWLDPEEE